MAYQIGYDIVVDDDKWKDAMEEICRRISQYEDNLEQYIDILKRIKEDAIMEGDIADRLETFIEYVKKLKGEAEEIAIETIKMSASFWKDFDTADNYVC